MWNGIGWYGFIGPTTSTTDISLARTQHLLFTPKNIRNLGIPPKKYSKL